jgi:hypothetical protein
LKRSYLILIGALLIAVLAIVAGCGNDGGSSGGNGGVVDGGDGVVNGGGSDGGGLAQVLVFTSPG